MAIHRVITDPGIYFVTFTCFQWLHLIEQVNGYDLVYNWFDVLVDKGHSITIYVIMPNHLHVVLYFDGGAQSLNQLIGNGKRFMAYKVVERLELQGDHDLLQKLELSVKPKDRTRGKKHEIWEDAFDVKECRTEKFIMQKLIYIHNNPCTDKWKLAKEPHHYAHSSALFYFNGKTSQYPVRDYRDFLGMYLFDE